MKDSQLIQRTGHTLGLANSTLKAVLWEEKGESTWLGLSNSGCKRRKQSVRIGITRSKALKLTRQSLIGKRLLSLGWWVTLYFPQLMAMMQFFL